ncbi:MAG TPA: DsrH/TusB family sulfur metabolism protein [Blastocatellia bacterium]|jgi:sulfur relay protein TusB/DsrH
MTRYLFIESRDPFESRDAQFIVQTASALKQRGDDVTVFLVQNGVLAARKNARVSHLPQLAEIGVNLLADDFSLRERGIRGEEINREIRESSIDNLVDMLVQDNTKAIWH